jgi:acyl-[acyl-carrier-protein]-phospholipid O-acyltransferase/long-chain-fatty-acid--[acyl-carrier-protein] ligase
MVMRSSSFLFLSRRFLPLFVAQFFGAFNDNLFKSALIVSFTFGIFDKGGMENEVFVTLAGGLFILPFVLFSPLAGKYGDIKDKAMIVRHTKVVEVFIVFFAILSFLIQSLPFFLFVLFLFGVQSAFFGPVKYAILSHHLDPSRLSWANGAILFSTFIAILLGTIIGNAIVFVEGGLIFLSALLVIFVLLGLVGSFLVPSSVPHNASETRSIFSLTKMGVIDMVTILRTKSLRVIILSNSWFWGLGGLMVSLLAPMAHRVSEEHEVLVNLLFVSFVMGVGLGAWLTPRLVEIRGRRGYFCGCLVLMALMLVDLAFVFQDIFHLHESLFLIVTSALFIRIVVDLFFLAMAGGLFCIPLYTALQTRATQENRSAVFATNNIMNSILIVVCSFFVSLLFGFSVSMSSVFILFSIFCCVVGVLVFVYLEPLGEVKQED